MMTYDGSLFLPVLFEHIQRFKYINGNYRDETISNFFEMTNHQKKLNFKIAKKNQQCIHPSPDPIWQSNFIQCIHKGMKILYNMRPEYPLLQLDKNGLYIPAEKQTPLPTCHQFVKYLSCNIADEFMTIDTDCHEVEVEVEVEVDNIEPFSILALTPPIFVVLATLVVLIAFIRLSILPTASASTK